MRDLAEGEERRLCEANVRLARHPPLSCIAELHEPVRDVAAIRGVDDQSRILFACLEYHSRFFGQREGRAVATRIRHIIITDRIAVLLFTNGRTLGIDRLVSPIYDYQRIPCLAALDRASPS